MREVDSLRFLKSVDLFRFFSEEELHAFSAKVNEVRIARGSILFREGEAGDAMYLLISGLIKVFSGNRVIDILRPGDYLGEMAIIEKQPRSASVEAIEDSVLLEVPAAVFEEYFSRQPASLVAMMRTMSARVRRDIDILGKEFEQVNILVHDMKNLLTPFNLLEVLQRREPALAGDRLIECMIRARADLFTLLGRALDQAKRRQATTPIEKGSLDSLIAELKEAVWSVHPEIGGREIRVEVEGSLPEFTFSSLGLCRVLSNLVENAAQASPPGGVITIALSCLDDKAEVRIIDQGQGIPEQEWPRIFQPRYTTKPNGNGLGLISCRQIVEEIHGGSLTFHSLPGRGTTFVIRLPMEHPQA
ncbi:MAG: ATP-binding protein [Thermodesulfobacteriota bacterium]